MGIKGIYQEIGPGKRVALSKLAVDTLEKENRPLRIAIDISIWLFQTQAGKGGSNPAVRTLYYRLLRLLSLSIQPIFVFDGPNKPKFKRNKRVGPNGASLPNYLAKQVIKFFGFPCHNAPGEAEAECALLQREGLVDAVLSEDVDTLMFGCGVTLRNWSSENHNGAPTHVSMYEAEATRTGKSGLDREGMVLVAMMSGGDYITEGIPGCGVKTACEAAKAGFGSELCQLYKTNDEGFREWRERLLHEIQTNESKFFRVKRKAFKIPEDFPNREVLGYYTNPVVSTAEKITNLKRDLKWDGIVDVVGLRIFVAEAFDWTGRGGARKYVRGLGPAMLVSKLLSRGNRRASGLGDVILTAMDEMDLVRSITGKREHFSTDGITELRLNFVPNDIVGLDLEAESDESGDYGRSGLATNPDDDDGENAISEEDNISPRKRGPSTYDPTVIDKIWVPRTIAKFGVPLKVEDYEEDLRNPKKPVRKTAKPRATAKKAIASNMPKGAMDKFVKTSKPGSSIGAIKDLDEGSFNASQSVAPQVFHAPAVEDSSTVELKVSKRTSGVKGISRGPLTKVDATASRTTRTRTTKKVALTTQANPFSKFTSTNADSTSSSARITRHANEPKPVFKAPARAAFSPEPEPPSRPLSSREPGYTAKNSEAPSGAMKGQVTPKKRDSQITGYFTPPSKKPTKETCIPNAFDIKVPFSEKKVNRRLDFSPMVSTPERQGSTLRVSREATSSSMFPDADDVFSPAKGGSSFIESLNTSFLAESHSLPAASVKNTDREVITIDSSPPASPTPARRKKTSYVSEMSNPSMQDEQIDSLPLSPTKSSSSSSLNLPQNERGKKVGGRRRFLALRSSLEGSWKEVEEAEIRGKEGRVWGVDEVEVVDLSGD